MLSTISNGDMYSEVTIVSLSVLFEQEFFDAASTQLLKFDPRTKVLLLGKWPFAGMFGWGHWL